MILSHPTAPLAALVRGVALATVLALPAAAATMQAVYTGTVSSSDDQTGVFGGAGSLLDGLAFTATFRYDTTLGVTDDFGFYQDLYGGPAFVSTSPVFYAALAINGVTRMLDLSYSSEIKLYDESSVGGTTTQTNHFARDCCSDGLGTLHATLQVTLGSYDGSVAVPLDLTQPFTARIDPQNINQFGGGGFLIALQDWADLGSDHYREYAAGSFAATRLVVTNLSAAVPLPAGLPLLLLALCGLGLVARRRRVTGA